MYTYICICIMFCKFLLLIIISLDRDGSSRCAKVVSVVPTKSTENELSTGLIIANTRCSIRLTTSMLPRVAHALEKPCTVSKK